MVGRKTQERVDSLLDTKIGRWSIVSQSFTYGSDRYKGHYLDCVCDCGTEKTIRVDSLLRGDSQSCGCLARELASIRTKALFYKEDANHRHPLNEVYKSMRSRCYREKDKSYKWYGAKGVKLCDRWMEKDGEGFRNFVKDMYGSYEKGLEIERLEVDGDYCPENCTWITRRSQLQNTTRSRMIKGFGIELTTTEWGEFLCFSGKLLDDRVNNSNKGNTIEEALYSTLRDRKHTLLYEGRECTATEVWISEGFTEGQRNGRITKHGGSVEALRAEGVDFEVVKPREKEYLSFEEALDRLRAKARDTYEEHLLYKIEDQLKGETNDQQIQH